MSDRVRQFGWSETPLGPLETWPQSLRTAVNILLSSRYAMWMCWGPQLTFLYNDTYLPTLGLKSEWALGSKASDVWAEIWPDIGPRIDSVLETGQATFDQGLLLFLERSGFPEETYHTFSYSPLTDDDGKIAGMLCVVTEETERLIGERRMGTLRDLATGLAAATTEDELLETVHQRLSENTLDVPFCLVYLFDGAGQASLGAVSGSVSEGPLAPSRIEVESNFPWPAQRVLSGEARILIQQPELAAIGDLPKGVWNRSPEQVAVREIRQAGHERPLGFLVVGINPHRRYSELYEGFLELLAGQVTAGIGSARAYEAERQKAEALAELDRAKTAFFSNVSHEFRTPLTLMLGPLEEAMSAEGMSARSRDLVAVAHRNSLRLLRLVNSLLDFARIEAGRIQARYEPVDLSALTRDIASTFRSAIEKAGLTFRIESSMDDEPVYVDREMWEKVVLNLISNAFKFTLQGEITVELSASNGWAQLRVIDTGSGIPAEELPRLFDRFHRVEGSRGRTHEGSGIGLALVRELVGAHTGTSSVESRVGVGSTFSVRIPLGNSHLPADRIAVSSPSSMTATRADAFLQEALRWLPEAAESVPASGAENELGGMVSEHFRIVLAEDNADMREYVTRLLNSHMEVVAVANGREALDAILENPPDLVLSDIMMPVMNGFELLKAIRANSFINTLPVILLSARAGEESLVEGVGAGADDYLMKPFSARELFTRVTAHLKMARLRRESLEAVLRTQAELRAHREELSRQVAEFDTLFRELPIGVGVSRDRRCDYIQINPAMARMLGMDGSQNASKSPRNDARLPFRVMRDGKEVPADQLPMQLAASLGQEVRDFEFELVRSDGVRLHEYGHAVPLWDGQGQVSGSVGVFLDITERKLAEEGMRVVNEQLRRANDDLNQFAYSASHDLQEPLRNISIASQLIQRKLGGSTDPELQTFLGFMVEGATRMESLLRDLLSYTRITSADAAIEVTDSGMVVSHVLEALHASIMEADAAVVVDELPMVPVNELHLHQLFQNLIGNALKYRDQKRQPEVRVSAVFKDGKWEFCVKDNGIGIAEPFHQRIFGIFKRLHTPEKYAGTGIGLAIAQRIVHRYGGEIRVVSQLGDGAAFYFTLPACEMVG